MQYLDSVIMTISGIGYINGGMILGRLATFIAIPVQSSYLHLLALTPSVYQSRNFRAKRTRMTKRGSKVLRYALMNAAHNVGKKQRHF